MYFGRRSWILLVICFPFISPLRAADRSIDFERIIPGPPAQTGRVIGTDSNGFIFTIGTTVSPNTFPVTKGALSLPFSYNETAIFIQKLSADGSQVLFSSLVAFLEWGDLAGKVDVAGNIYLAFYLINPTRQNPGITVWKGDPDGRFAVLKIASTGDRILYASKALASGDGIANALDLHSDGSAIVATTDTYTAVHLQKISPAGDLTWSWTFNDVKTSGGITYDERFVGVAVRPDHSVCVAASPSFVYCLDNAGQTEISHLNLGQSSTALASIAADPDGGLWIGGQSTPGFSVPSSQVDYSEAPPGNGRGLIIKFDPNLSVLSSSLFDITTISALAPDGSNGLWAAGASQSGIAVLDLSAAGTDVKHYFSFAASGQNRAYTIAVDDQGRPMIAGASLSLRIPDSGSMSGAGGLNALFMRLNPNAPAADLQIEVSAAYPSASIYGQISWSISVTNNGPATAQSAYLKLPEFNSGSGISQNFLSACTASSGGACLPASFNISSGGLRIALPPLAPGATASAHLTYSVPSPSPATIQFPIAALTSTDDPFQLNNHGASDVAIEPPTLSLSVKDIPAMTVDVAGIGPAFISCASCPSATFPPGVPVRIYVPETVLANGGVYAFTAWSDGNTENPRTFSAAKTALQANFRRVTEPWFQPDNPVQNAASYHSGSISPGEIVTIFGYNLGPSVLQKAQLDSQGKISAQLAGTQVLFDEFAAPMVFTSAGQLAAIVPYEIAGRSNVKMKVQYQGVPSAAVAIPVTDAAPGIFTAASDGLGLLAAFNQDGQKNSASQLASRGDVVVFYATGEGLSSPLPGDGVLAQGTPPVPQLPVKVTIAGQSAPIAYIGGVPTLTAGIIQINAVIPQSVPSGLLPVILTVGTETSQQEATIAVQ